MLKVLLLSVSVLIKSHQMLSIAASPPLITGTAPAAASNSVISLNGPWRLALDEGNEGLARGFQHQVHGVAFNETMVIPGTSIGAAGFGPETDQKYHSYTSIAWFTRNFSLPTDWGGELTSTFVLSCGGVKSSATVWLDGVWIGNHSGYMDGFELELPTTLRAALIATPSSQHWLTVRLDGSGCFTNTSNATACSCGGGCFTSQNSGPWSGIWGEIALQRRGPLALTQVTARTLSLGDLDGGSATIELTATLGNGVFSHVALLAGAQLEVVITEHGAARRVVMHRYLPLQDVIIEGYASRSVASRDFSQLRVELPIESPKLWSPRSPSLYHANLSISNSDSTAHIRFGVRQVKLDGPYFVLNGKRHFMLGTGDDFGYPTEAPPQNKSVYLARLGAMKLYGFNFVRLHSHFESKMYFDVAEELGFFISPALPGGICHEIALRTWKWWINELRNTASVMDIDMTNEAYGQPPKQQGPLGASVEGWPGGPFPFKDEFYAVAKQMRPELYVLQTDGCCWSASQRNKSAVQETVDGPDICPEPYANGTCAWPTNDFMTPSFGIQTPMVFPKMYADTQCGAGRECGPPPKPMISHEMGNFGTFPDLPLMLSAMESTNLKTDSREARIKQYAAEGFGTSVLNHWVEISKAHAYFCWKATVEYLRLSPHIAGHSWWLFQDWLGASNGLVDYFFQPKNGALAPDKIGQFVHDVVLLVSNGTLWMENEQSAVYLAGSTIFPQLVVSNYFPDNLSSCNVTWDVALTNGMGSGSSFAGGHFVVASIAQGSVVPAGAPLTIHLPAALQPSRFNLSVAMSCEQLAQPRFNDWQAWVYPQPDDKVSTSGRQVFASASIIDKIKSVSPDVKPLPQAIHSSFASSRGSDSLYIASQADLAAAAPSTAAELLAAVKAGSSLLVPEFAPCAAKGGCPLECTPPCNTSVQNQLVPFERSPLLFHSPWWTNDAVTPTALFWAKEGYFENSEGATNPGRPASLGGLSTPDGRIDDSWFGGLGPVPSNCPGRIRTGIVFNNGASAPSGPAPIKPTWSCPTEFPFPSIYNERICYNESKYAHALGGPCNSWCTDDPTCGNCRGDCKFIYCSVPAPNVTKCPAEFPYNSSVVPELCYNKKKDAVAGSGPCDSWCTKRVWDGCGCKCGCGCGDPAKKICNGFPPAPPPTPPAPPPEPFQQVLARYNGTLWVGAVFGSNFPVSSGGPLGGVIVHLQQGKGRIVLSGVDLDLEACNHHLATPSSNPHQLFDETLLKALIDATQ